MVERIRRAADNMGRHEIAARLGQAITEATDAAHARDFEQAQFGEASADAIVDCEYYDDLAAAWSLVASEHQLIVPIPSSRTTGRSIDPSASNRTTLMHAQSTPARSTDHCFGIMHHRLAWWLVEFPDLDATPLCARKLGPAHAGPCRLATRRDRRFAPRRRYRRPQSDSRCWSGEFSYVPAAGADLFDIDAHPWGSEASELETRLARAMIDATLHPIPSGFVSVFGALPPRTSRCSRSG
jgi:hypothetical protein